MSQTLDLKEEIIDLRLKVGFMQSRLDSILYFTTNSDKKISELLKKIDLLEEEIKKVKTNG